MHLKAYTTDLCDISFQEKKKKNRSQFIRLCMANVKRLSSAGGGSIINLLSIRNSEQFIQMTRGVAWS